MKQVILGTMTIGKAIEILLLDRTGHFEGAAADLEQAQQYGIEALERIQEIRKFRTLIGQAASNPGRLLPSEKEVCLYIYPRGRMKLGK